VERVADPAEVGAGLLLQPNGLAVLIGLGLDDALVSAGVSTAGNAVRSADGRVISRIAAPDYGPGLDQFIAIRRGALYSALLAAVRDDSTVSCHFGTMVVSANAAGRITVSAGPADSRVFAADLVIGADGTRSTVRAAGDFGATTSATGHRYLRAIVPAVAGETTELAGEYWTEIGLFGGTRIDNSHLYFYADVTSGPVADAAANRNLQDLSNRWASALPVAGELLRRVTSFDQLLINDVTTVRCRRWFDGRLVLIGDAAHAMPPTAGQGANSALVDAAILAHQLRQDPPDEALTAFDRRRRPAVRKVQRRAEQLARLAGLRGKLTRKVRDSGFRLLSTLPGTGQRISDSLQQENPAELVSIVRETVSAG
jgi:2-polyprenyl-6-methoxyphenol hydroxylase-like FAD-dependent oxidoreductase